MPIQLLPSAMHLFVGSDNPRNRCSAHSLLSHVASFADGSSTDSISPFGVLISSTQPDRNNPTTQFMKYIGHITALNTLETSPSISNIILNSLLLPSARALRHLDTPHSFVFVLCPLHDFPELDMNDVEQCESMKILVRQMRMEDLEDTVEGRLLTDRKGDWGGGVVSNWMVLRSMVGLIVGQTGIETDQNQHTYSYTNHLSEGEISQSRTDC
ncbi:hypothetical protein BLNAU_7495 [Blattamonas nauphoetae]|uniref:Uncharacterized protein n=1 Tax=Blattamonas nauphoetae TaxID=2049346 RepID=A0ABQ9Y1I4_9EUKA|nr:hypothetical protein BLNAU_7495 [Blattamonas nauphoetae]